MEEKEAQRVEMVAQNPIALSHQEDDMGNASQSSEKNMNHSKYISTHTVRSSQN
jgi:hypothetical protein